MATYKPKQLTADEKHELLKSAGCIGSDDEELSLPITILFWVVALVSSLVLGILGFTASLYYCIMLLEYLGLIENIIL